MTQSGVPSPEESARQFPQKLADCSLVSGRTSRPVSRSRCSTDVDGPVTVAVKGDALSITYAAGVATLRHIARDRFASPEEDFNSVRFQRGKSGRVTGLTLTVSSGITRLRFVKA